MSGTGRREHWSALDTPCLLVDLHQLEANIVSMAERARSAGVLLRPHFKTHKSLEIARLQQAHGIAGMTVSKLDEAEVLLRGGFHDVLVATQVVSEPKLQRAIDLARLGRLILAVDSVRGAQAIAQTSVAAGVAMEVSIEVDSGLKRCGVGPEDVGSLASHIDTLSGVTLAGAFTHAGHAYAAASRQDVAVVAEREIEAMTTAADSARRSGIGLGDLSVGSTPTVLTRDHFPGVDEIRPGNYVFLDNMQVALGVAGGSECALTVAATVMSRPAADRVVVDAGSKSLGLDKGAHGVGDIDHYGIFVGTPGRLARLSEEHGVAEVPADSPLRVGDKVRIRPNHACSVANLHRSYAGVRDGQVEGLIAIDAAQAIH